MLPQQTKPQTTTNTEDFDSAVLQLYPSLLTPKNAGSQQKKRAHRRLLCLKTTSAKASTREELAQKTGLSRFQVTKTMQAVITLGLVNTQKTGRKTAYTLTTKGTVAVMLFREFPDWQNVKSTLTVPQKKNDPLSYALLVIGFSSNKPDTIYTKLFETTQFRPQP